MNKYHTLAILVENKPGVLGRVVALFARRGYNIASLAVGETEHPEVSRISVVVKADRHPIDQIEKQLDRLVNVLQVKELAPDTSVSRQLVMLKVQADDSTRVNVLQIVDLFRAHVVDVTPQSVVVESVGSQAKLDALLVALEPYGITEIVQSGAVAIGRGPRALAQNLHTEKES